MDFLGAVRACLGKYATFTGRSGRAECWWYFLFTFAVGAAAAAFSNALSLVAGLALLLPTLAVTTRRLHDTGRSGWMQLVGLFPVAGWLVVLYWLTLPSARPNRWGTGPDRPITSFDTIPPDL